MLSNFLEKWFLKRLHRIDTDQLPSLIYQTRSSDQDNDALLRYLYWEQDNSSSGRGHFRRAVKRKNGTK